MKFSKIDYSDCGLKEFKLWGCKSPNEKEPVPSIFVSTIFAKNFVIARSIFFKLLKQQYKIKATQGRIVKYEELKPENDFKVKNYRISFVYKTRTGLQNGYKEIRHISRPCAVNMMYQEFGSRHKIKQSDIYIIEVQEISDEECTKAKCLAYSAPGVKYPVFKKVSNSERHFNFTTENIFN